MNYITVLNKKIEIKWSGPPPEKAPTLVFLHEGLGSVAQWNDFPVKLAEATGCGALVYSRTGYGNSDPCELPRPVTFMHDEGLVVLPEIIRIMGIKKTILVGHSDGGSIAIIFAGGTPALTLCGLITEAAHLFCEDITVRSIRKAKVNYETGDLKSRLQKYHWSNTDYAFYGWNDVWLNPDFLKWNIEEFLPGIKVPFLAIQGEDDQYGTMAQIESIKNNTGGKAETSIIKKCGHNPHKEKGKETFSVMSDFIINILKE